MKKYSNYSGKKFRPDRANSIGIIQNYRCTNSCVHCLYACHQGITEEFPGNWIERVVSSIADSVPEAPIHIGGGEPFLHMEMLKRLIREILRQGLILEYVETNGFWINKKEARSLLEEVREAGCERLLLSISPFHNAFLSVDDNTMAFDMIIEVFGENGIFPWSTNYYPFLKQLPTEKPVDFWEYSRKFSREELLYQLTQVIYLHPAGRAACNFAEILPTRSAKAYLDKNCKEELSSPVHAHVDFNGNYCAGFCAGLTVGHESGFELERLFNEGVGLENYPLLSILTGETLEVLYRDAQELGFRELTTGYVSPCHLCGHIRAFFFQQPGTENKYQELSPAFFYEEMWRIFH